MRSALDLGACIFCGECAAACPPGAIVFTREFRLAVSEREDMVVGEQELHRAEALGKEIRTFLAGP